MKWKTKLVTGRVASAEHKYKVCGVTEQNTYVRTIMFRIVVTVHDGADLTTDASATWWCISLDGLKGAKRCCMSACYAKGGVGYHQHPLAHFKPSREMHHQVALTSVVKSAPSWTVTTILNTTTYVMQVRCHSTSSYCERSAGEARQVTSYAHDVRTYLFCSNSLLHFHTWKRRKNWKRTQTTWPPPPPPPPRPPPSQIIY